MIGRIWHGRIRSTDVEAYRRYIGDSGLADYRSTPGNLGAYMLTRVDGEVAHVMTVSFWDSVDSIRAFAGDDVTRARYYPRDTEFLLEFPERVQHWTVDAA